MTETKIIPVILSGGTGKRLWPLSRKAHPKQLLPLVTEKTMVQETVLRLSGSIFSDPVFVCDATHAGAISEQMAEVGKQIEALIIEPIGRNTASCAVSAALYARHHHPDTLILLAPADHHVTKPEIFQENVRQAINVAKDGYLVTFGITPSGPETGYGYIQQGEELSESIFKVATFREKPDAETAKKYVSDGNFAWNAGIFLFSADTLISEIEKHAPNILSATQKAYDQATIKGNYIHLDHESFSKCPVESIDYAVMESTKKAAVFPSNIGWSDIGSYLALYKELVGANGQAFSGDVLTHNSHNCLVSSDGPLVSLVGISNLGVIIRNGAIMIVNLEQSQDVKKITEIIKSRPDNNDWL